MKAKVIYIRPSDEWNEKKNAREFSSLGSHNRNINFLPALFFLLEIGCRK